jgi:DnaK suppressor protein
MDINFADAKKAVRRGQRSANHVIDVAHDMSQRKLAQARHAADEALDAGDYAARRTRYAAKSAHEWMEEKPHLAALEAGSGRVGRAASSRSIRAAALGSAITRLSVVENPAKSDFLSKSIFWCESLAACGRRERFLYSRQFQVHPCRRTRMSLSSLSPDYRPSDDEPFMSPIMLEYFRMRLLKWQSELVQESNETLASLQIDGGMQEPDLADRASVETDRALELRTRDRERKLLSKISAALLRIEDGSYGYCEETGDPIGVKRLDARPIATLSLEAQERHERLERTQRDD